MDEPPTYSQLYSQTKDLPSYEDVTQFNETDSSLHRTHRFEIRNGEIVEYIPDS